MFDIVEVLSKLMFELGQKAKAQGNLPLPEIQFPVSMYFIFQRLDGQSIKVKRTLKGREILRPPWKGAR